MERRNFLKVSSIGSACLLSGTMISNDAKAKQTEKEYKCKITVLRKTHNKEWGLQFREMEGEPCNIFNEGQEFVIENVWMVPEGFCPWAWADIRTFIHKVNDGAMDTFISCCTDGFRPVFFKIEKMEI
jgi:uncharacterized repeat protein (TIGR04076 family)